MSVCPNCGSEVESGALACDVCGALMPDDSFGDPFNGMPKKKKSKLPIIIGAGVAVVAIGCGGAFAAVKTGFYQKYLASPKNYLMYVGAKNGEELLNNFTKAYNTTTSMTETGNNNTLTTTFRIGDAYKNILSLYAPDLDLTLLEDISLTVGNSINDSEIDGFVSLAVNGRDLLTANSSMDLTNNIGYVQFPDLSDELLMININELTDSMGIETNTSESVLTSLPDATSVEQFLTKYVMLIFNDLETVNKSKMSISEATISEDVTVLTVTLTPDNIATLTNDLAVALNDDENADALMQAYFDYAVTFDPYSITDANALMDSYKQSLRDIIANPMTAADLEMDGNLLFAFYVDKNDQMIGYKLSFADEDLAEFYSLSDSNDSATRFYIYDGYTSYAIAGESTTYDQLLNGTYTLSADDLDMITVDITDYDLAQAENGYLNGTFTFSPSSYLMSEMGSDLSVLSFASPALQLTCTSDNGTFNFDCSLQIGGSELAALNIAAEPTNEEFTSIIPADPTVAYDIADNIELSQYVDSIKWDKFEDLINDSGMTEALNSILNQLSDFVIGDTY